MNDMSVFLNDNVGTWTYLWSNPILWNQHFWLFCIYLCTTVGMCLLSL